MQVMRIPFQPAIFKEVRRQGVLENLEPWLLVFVHAMHDGNEDTLYVNHLHLQCTHPIQGVFSFGDFQRTPDLPKLTTTPECLGWRIHTSL